MWRYDPQEFRPCRRISKNTAYTQLEIIKCLRWVIITFDSFKGSGKSVTSSPPFSINGNRVKVTRGSLGIICVI